jgi:hypothetical protein
MVIGIVCPRCRDFVTSYYNEAEYRKQLKAYENECRIKEVLAELDKRKAPKKFPPSPPQFVCIRCKLILEPTDGMRDHITVNELRDELP